MIKRYEKYKESGIEWVGEIPTHWIKVKLGRSFQNIGSGTTPNTGNDSYYENGIINWLNTGDLNDGYITSTSKKISEVAFKEHSVLKLYPVDSIVIALYGATIGKLGHLKIETTTNQACCVISQSKDVTNRYLYYFLLAAKEFIISKSYGGGQPNISQDTIKQLHIVAPKLTEQTQIANFLDHQTAIIDDLIGQKEKLIALLKEKRQAIINEAVTKGLNPNTKMKDSGIEWLGEVPEEWNITKMKFIATINRGAILRPVDDPNYFDENGEWTYLNISDATKCDKYLDEGNLRLSELGSTKSARVLPNNLILTASATIGKPFINRIPVCVHDGFIPITSIKCSIDYLYHYLRNPQLYIELGKSNTQKNIYLDEVKNMLITQPPLGEQIEIFNFIESYELKNNKLILSLHLQIAKLKDYRQSLISEAVTGKIDVREWKLANN